MSYAETSWHHHYVSVIDGQRSGMLLGPFRTRQEAEARVDEVRKYAQSVNRDAIWYGFGTSRVTAKEARPGLLNAQLEHLLCPFCEGGGVVPSASGWTDVECLHLDRKAS